MEFVVDGAGEIQMIESSDISILQKTLDLRKDACKEYTACDICPFNDGTDYSDVYKCKLEESVRELIEMMFSDKD